MKPSLNPRVIQHDGIVQSIGKDKVTVRISSSSACSGCHAEGTCSLSGKEEKIIDVSGNYSVNEGDSVVILMNQAMGYNALILGYLMPLLAVMTMLIILVSFSISELNAGLFSLAILIPYYLTLYFFRNRINKKFTFTLKG
jgi:sigma-E factor negative regulatory protein RseC